jgi:hypothetical protein
VIFHERRNPDVIRDPGKSAPGPCQGLGGSSRTRSGASIAATRRSG